MGWVGLGLRLVPYIVEAVMAVERLVTGRGEEKEQAAMDMAKNVLQTLEKGLDRDILDDVEVEDAARSIARSVVHFQNVVAAKKNGQHDAGA